VGVVIVDMVLEMDTADLAPAQKSMI